MDVIIHLCLRPDDGDPRRAHPGVWDNISAIGGSLPVRQAGAYGGQPEHYEICNMLMNQIWIVSILENKPYKDVKGIWKLFEREFNSMGVQIFSHPHITFQGAKTDNPRQLKEDLQKVVTKIKPFEIEVSGIRHFDQKVIYLKVEKTDSLIKLNKLFNRFLKNHCDDLLEYFTPKNWVPYVTLATDDLTKRNFRKAWDELKDSKIKFKQKLHNICVVKRYPNGKIKIAKRYEL